MAIVAEIYSLEHHGSCWQVLSHGVARVILTSFVVGGRPSWARQGSVDRPMPAATPLKPDSFSYGLAASATRLDVLPAHTLHYQQGYQAGNQQRRDGESEPDR